MGTIGRGFRVLCLGVGVGGAPKVRWVGGTPKLGWVGGSEARAKKEKSSKERHEWKKRETRKRKE